MASAKQRAWRKNSLLWLKVANFVKNHQLKAKNLLVKVKYARHERLEQDVHI